MLLPDKQRLQLILLFASLVFLAVSVGIVVITYAVRSSASINAFRDQNRYEVCASRQRTEFLEDQWKAFDGYLAAKESVDSAGISVALTRLGAVKLADERIAENCPKP